MTDNFRRCKVFVTVAFVTRSPLFPTVLFEKHSIHLLVAFSFPESTILFLHVGLWHEGLSPSFNDQTKCVILNIVRPVAKNR